MEIERRSLITGAMTAAAILPFASSLVHAAPRTGGASEGPFVPPGGARARVLYLNDLAGDIDGLFATVHMILSPSVDLRSIVGTAGDIGGQAREATALADEMLQIMNRTSQVRTIEGAGGKLSHPETPVRSAGTQAIIEEALRTDTTLPLYVAVGGGLTEVASALLIEPRIADRFTLVWIGGGKPHPEGARLEPNFSIDPLAAQHVYNATTVPIWQVPSEVYQTCIISAAELHAYAAPHGAIGRWLYERLLVQARKYKPVFNPGATWSLGDSPLVVLTALNDWVPSSRVSDRGPFSYQRTGSSCFDEMIAPRLDANGRAIPRQNGRSIRLYRSIDTRLMFGDFFAKLQENAPA